MSDTTATIPDPHDPDTVVLHLPPHGPRSRVHLGVRLLVLVATSALGGAIGWPGGLVYVGLPAAAAVLISEHGAARYLADDAHLIRRLLRWLIGFYAYLGLVTDHFPLGADADPVALEVAPAGAPTVKSAALRIFTSLPYAIALVFLGVASCVAWFVAAAAILVHGRYPRALYDLQAAVLRYHARFLCYHASLVPHLPMIVVAQDAAPATSGGTP